MTRADIRGWSLTNHSMLSSFALVVVLLSPCVCCFASSDSQAEIQPDQAPQRSPCFQLLSEGGGFVDVTPESCGANQSHSAAPAAHTPLGHVLSQHFASSPHHTAYANFTTTAPSDNVQVAAFLEMVESAKVESASGEATFCEGQDIGE